MDKPVRFFINTENLPGEVTGKLVAMGKQLLARFNFMKEFGMVGDVWTQRTNDGIVFKLDKSGDVDNVKIFMPIMFLKKAREEKEHEKDITNLIFIMELIDYNLDEIDGFYVWDNIETDSASRLFIKEDEVLLYELITYDYKIIDFVERDYKLKELELISTYSYGLSRTITTTYILDESTHKIYDTAYTLNIHNGIPWPIRSWIVHWEVYRTSTMIPWDTLQIIGEIPITEYPTIRIALVEDNPDYPVGSTYIFVLREEIWNFIHPEGSVTYDCERVYTLHYSNPDEGHKEFELLRLPSSVDYNESKAIVISGVSIYEYGKKVLYCYSLYNSWNETYTYEYIYNGIRHQSPAFPLGKSLYGEGNYDAGSYHDFHGSTTNERAIKYGHEYWAFGRMRAAEKTVPGNKSRIIY